MHEGSFDVPKNDKEQRRFELKKTHMEKLAEDARKEKDELTRIAIFKQIKKDTDLAWSDNLSQEDRDWLMDAFLAADHGAKQLSQEQIDKINADVIRRVKESKEKGEPMTEDDVKQIATHIARQQQFYSPKEEETWTEWLVGNIKELIGLKASK